MQQESSLNWSFTRSHDAHNNNMSALLKLLTDQRPLSVVGLHQHQRPLSVAGLHQHQLPLSVAGLHQHQLMEYEDHKLLIAVVCRH